MYVGDVPIRTDSWATCYKIFRPLGIPLKVPDQLETAYSSLIWNENGPFTACLLSSTLAMV